MIFTVSAYDLAGFSEKQDAVGGGDVELKPLRSVLDQLREELEHGSGDLKKLLLKSLANRIPLQTHPYLWIVVPNLHRPL